MNARYSNPMKTEKELCNECCFRKDQTLLLHHGKMTSTAVTTRNTRLIKAFNLKKE
jgi:hypothetical protein